MKKLKRGKASVHDTVMAEMILDGGSCLHGFTMQMYNRTLQGQFLENLSLTAVFKSGDVHDMGNYRGTTVLPALAKLFAMMLKNRISDYMEGNNLRGQGHCKLTSSQITTQLIMLSLCSSCLNISKRDKSLRTLHVFLNQEGL